MAPLARLSHFAGAHGLLYGDADATDSAVDDHRNIGIGLRLNRDDAQEKPRTRAERTEK